MPRWRSLQQLRDDFKASGIELGKPTPAGPGTQGCRGKVRHVSRDAAATHVARLQHDGREYRGQQLQAYDCRFCHFWHVGNRRHTAHGRHTH